MASPDQLANVVHPASTSSSSVVKATMLIIINIMFGCSVCKKMNTKQQDVYHSYTKILLLIFGSLIILVVVSGNTLVIVAVSTTRRLRSVTNCFVVSLAVADLLVGVLVMPLAVAKEVAGTWLLDRISCSLWISLDVLLCTASILNLCCISLDRYLAITRPLAYSARRSKRLALAMIGVVWLASAAITCPPLFGWYEEGRATTSDGDCSYIDDQGYVLYSSVGSFFLPLVIMVYVYACIMRVIAKRERVLRQRRRRRKTTLTETELSDAGERQHEGPSTTTSDSGPEAPSTSSVPDDNESSSSGHQEKTQKIPSKTQMVSTPSEGLLTVQAAYRPRRRSRHRNGRGEKASFLREKKAAKTLAIVVGGFVICWLPFFLIYVIHPFCGENCTFPVILWTSLTWLGWINSAINPFIYAFYNLDFRAAFWRLTVGSIRRRGRWANSRERPQLRVLEPEQTTSSVGGRGNNTK